MEPDGKAAASRHPETYLAMLETSLKKVYPITDTARFDDLLMALDQADSQLGHDGRRRS